MYGLDFIHRKKYEKRRISNTKKRDEHAEIKQKQPPSISAIMPSSRTAKGIMQQINIQNMENVIVLKVVSVKKTKYSAHMGRIGKSFNNDLLVKTRDCFLVPARKFLDCSSFALS